ncbi:protein NYNRIN-like isoform X2 [Anguilla anguilla]|uniref:protein NYNRIN-like isoform X2 n=1 Tax=Anguilla anguilla TaxID=7936 RepID=UPI0015AA683E|nr:protein NYNRIN-like isoform X2 [Anguilla anguilla]
MRLLKATVAYSPMALSVCDASHKRKTLPLAALSHTAIASVATPIVHSWDLTNKFQALCATFPACWSVHKLDCGAAPLPPLEVTGTMPSPVKQYPIKPEAAQAVGSIIQSLLSQEVIEPCVSPCNSPVWPVQKPDGSWRLTIDYRTVNAAADKLAPIVSDPNTLLADIKPSHCIFSVIDIANGFHDFMVNWSSRGFLTSSGTPIKNGGVVQNLITASKLPNKLAVVKVKAHTKGQDAISLGNHWADEAAKAAALNDSLPTYKIAAIDMSGPTNIDIAKLQDACTRAEKWTWIENACTLNDDNIWHTQDGKVVAPQSILSLLCEVYHGIAHNGERTMRHNMSLHWWSPKMTKVMKDFVRRCIICAKSNQGPKIKVMMKHQPRPTGPFQQIQMDFIGPLPKSHGKEHCLVLIDHFTRWVEVYPVACANAATTAKIIASEFCPRWGLPCYIDSDQGTHFTGKVMKQASRSGSTNPGPNHAHHPKTSKSLKNSLPRTTAAFTNQVQTFQFFHILNQIEHSSYAPIQHAEFICNHT